jgi:hypothetical protein
MKKIANTRRSEIEPFQSWTILDPYGEASKASNRFNGFLRTLRDFAVQKFSWYHFEKALVRQ